VVQLAASRFVPVDPRGIPVAAPRPVADTPLDFRRATPLGDRWRQDFEQLQVAGGYDHCWVLDAAADQLEPGWSGEAVVAPAARVVHPGSGRTLEVATDQPGLQCYSGNHLDGTQRGAGGLLRQGDAFCLEPQRLPDAPNRAGFGPAVLRPGQEYRHRTGFRFTVDAAG
jgi:aldose 1-epimerase